MLSRTKNVHKPLLRTISARTATLTVTLVAVGAALMAPSAAHAAPTPPSLDGVLTQLTHPAARTADPFYTPPATAADAPLGSLVRSEPMRSPIIEKMADGVAAQRILYVTSGARGGRDVASAVVLIPSQRPPHGDRSLVAVGVADESMGAYCHPTTTFASSGMFEQQQTAGPAAWAAIALKAGHAVIIADLANNGGPAPTPTLVPRYDGTALLDGLRATLTVPGSGLTAASKVGVYGPSGGGSGAAAWAAQLAPTYAPELHLTAALIGQIVPDHRKFIAENSGKFASGFAFADLLGLEVAHPDMRIDDKLNPTGKAVADAFRTGCTYPNYAALAYLPLDVLFKPGHSPYAEKDYEKAFAAEALATPSSPVPTATLRMTRCDSNLSPLSVTPVDDLARAARTYRANGADVSTRVVNCLAGTGDPYTPDMYWLLGRL